VTLVLVLAESHLSIHTWPEEEMVAVDLFSCGTIDAARVVEVLRVNLGLCRVIVRQVRRGTGAARGG
jgi:S-adenosylmethionine/arginine decarboxylase-like enzyme